MPSTLERYWLITIRPIFQTKYNLELSPPRSLIHKYFKTSVKGVSDFISIEIYSSCALVHTQEHYLFTYLFTIT